MSEIRVGVPWNAPGLHRFNGDHPLPSSLIADYPGYRFDFTLSPADAAHIKDATAAAAGLRKRLQTLTPAPSAELIEEFIVSRGLQTQAMMLAPCDLHFLHTAPLTLGVKPWILHIEEMITLFAPFVWHGTSANVNIRELPAYRMVKQLLEAPACRAVFSHLRHSYEFLPVLFDSEALAAKVHHIPLGLEFSPAATKKIAERQGSRGSGDGTTFLFTNSWSQQEGSFILRGGADVLGAFIELVAKHPSSRLIILSTLPVSHYGAGFADFARKLPNVHIIETRVSDDELVDLMLAADVFLIPSVGLHALSILRAMYCGLAVVVSDAPGNDEYVRHDQTGVIVEGRRGKTAWYDEIGFLHQTFEPVFGKSLGAFAGNLFRAMEQLVDDHERRLRIGQAARQHVLREHAIEPWRAGFQHLLDGIRPSL
ncbi:MAG: glycosyltransferase family 4 protein [Alphaproteobacteria bacterium]|nr:glycosyltransferase family 4 protein [Alphaproteobacteria bacterium]